MTKGRHKWHALKGGTTRYSGGMWQIMIGRVRYGENKEEKRINTGREKNLEG